MHVLLAAVLLAGEPVALDDDARPHFTEHQIEATASCTREGFAMWAATPQGKEILAKFRGEERDVRVIESADEPGVGRAPQPGFATLLEFSDAPKRKQYDLVLNPALAREYDNKRAIALGLPKTSAEVMAVAWAAEMLHIDFYAGGILLPHHQRADFQERWLSVSGALGFPLVRHDSGD
jgi:hypothetical protein